MRAIFALVLVMGIGLAGFAAYLAKNRFDDYQQTVAQQAAQLQSTVPVEDVYIVNRQIAYGERITEDDVVAVSWPNNAIPEGAFQTMEAIFPEDGKLRAALRVIEKHEALMAVKLTEPGKVPGFQLDAGMRAFALRVDVSSGVSGFLRPGDRVDVYWTGRSRGRDITTRIDTGLQLLAVDQITDGERASPTIARTVTVAADPTQVAALAQAQSSGRLTLALLGAGDIATSSVPVETDTDTVLGLDEIKQEIVQQEKVCTIKTRRGVEIVEIPIACPS